jgi:hypothetical protein
MCGLVFQSDLPDGRSMVSHYLLPKRGLVLAQSPRWVGTLKMVNPCAGVSSEMRSKE